MMKLKKTNNIKKIWSKGAKAFFVPSAIIILSIVAVFIKSQLLNNYSELPKLDDYKITSGVDYVPQEVIALADSLEQAQQKAKEYNIEFKSYSNGVAVFLAKNPEEVVKSSKQDVSLNRIYKTYQTNTPNTIEFPISDNIGLWHHKEIYTDRAWDYSTGEGATVAVIDTGIDVDHQAFTGRISDLSYNSQTEQVGKEYVVDDYGHGSHVSGIIASSIWTNNDITVSGIAPDAEILAIKANSDEGYFESASLLRGINYAVDNGADVINMSLGRIYYAGPDDLEHQTIIDAVDSGVTLVVSAGNDSIDHAGYPASYPEVIAVSATGSNFRFDSRYSNYGPEVDIAAPGTDVYSVDYSSNNPIKMTGTSMASPVVTGVAALVVSQNPTYTPADVRTALLGSAQEAGALGRDDRYGSGLVSAYAALLDPSELLDVTYNLLDDEKDPVIAKVAPGSKLIRPEIFVDGQNYHEWYIDQGLTTPFDFSSTIQDDTVLYEGSAELTTGSWLKEFPDENFRAFVMREIGVASELSLITTAQMEQLSSQKYSTLQLREKNIKDLTGIKYFSNTKRLYCSYNSLTYLDLSNNPKLLEVECVYNNLTSVDVSNNSALNYLYLYENDISTIDISNNIALKIFDIRANGMQSTDDVVGWQEIGLTLGDTFIYDPQFIGIAQQPLSQTNESGGQLTSINIQAYTKRDLTLEYQWYSNTTPTNSGGTLISGATSWMLGNESWQNKIGTYYYYCELIAKKDGEVVASVTSEVAEVAYYEQAYFAWVASPTNNRAFVTSIGGSITEPVNQGSYELSQITIDTLPTPRNLIEGVDYEINEEFSYETTKYYVFKESFLQSLPLGNYHITFDMIGGAGNGTDPVLNLTVSDQRVTISGELLISGNMEITMPGKFLSPDKSGMIPNIASTGFNWQWSRSETIDGVFAPIGDISEINDYYTVQEDDIGYYLQLTAFGVGTYTGEIISSNKILVNESAPILESIEITNPPDKTDYIYGETLDVTGLVVTAKYNDNSSRLITRYRITDPAPGDVLDNPYGGPVIIGVYVDYSEAGIWKYTSFPIRLKPFVPTELTSNVFTIDQENNLISNIPENTTAEMVLDGLNEKPPRNYPFISLKKNDFELDLSDFVGTGTNVSIMDWVAYDGNTLIRAYETVVKGDTDGDGVITSGDAYDIILHSIETKKLEGAYLEAAKINSSDEVTAGDAYDVLLYSIGAKESL